MSVHKTVKDNYTNHPRDNDAASRGRFIAEGLEQTPGSDGRLPDPVAVDGLHATVPDVEVPPADRTYDVLGQAEDVPPGLMSRGEVGDGGALSSLLGFETFPGKAVDLQRLANRLGGDRVFMDHPGRVVEEGQSLLPAHVKSLRYGPDCTVTTLVSIRLIILEIVMEDPDGLSTTFQNT